MEKKSAHCLAFIMDGVDAPRGVASAEREGGSEGHPLIPSLTQRSFACMEVGEGNFIACLSVRRSVGGMGSQSQKLSMSALDARTRGLRNVATLPKCLFARPRLSDRGNMHSLHRSNTEAQCQADMC